MSLTTVPINHITDWAMGPGCWEDLQGCDFLHKERGWLKLIEVDDHIIYMKDQHGETDGYANVIFNRDFVKVRVPTDGGMVEFFKDVSFLASLSHKFGLSYDGLVLAHANDKKRLGSLLRKMRGKEMPVVGPV